jgi:hypothetical protein
MSTLKLSNVQLGQSGTANLNYTLQTPATPDGTLVLRKGTPNNPSTAVFSVSSGGSVDFTVRPKFNSSDLAALSDFGKVNGANGYQRLPGGLLIQWGEASVSGNGGVVTYPITFTSQVFQVVSCDAGPGAHSTAAVNIGLTSFQNYSIPPGSTTYAITTGVRWVAIGI